ncbi:hypothetical protein [Wielerella bovis]|uniref:hypothetical protein n=1 Tax=Wielerella bovis TaxID=2917790 RepID=UPI002018FE9F|nr:hypothetical protein [Wielerella bovis]MCG7657800.1 hypothetical protein [Wielerella bovis]MCG7660022.1 hypothetical protein [Wielerella bovis]
MDLWCIIKPRGQQVAHPTLAFGAGVAAHKLKDNILINKNKIHFQHGISIGRFDDLRRYCNGFAGFGLMKWWGFFWGKIFSGSLKPLQNPIF